jgi:hypothetical protein
MTERQQRRLAAILAANMNALKGADEARAGRYLPDTAVVASH